MQKLVRNELRLRTGDQLDSKPFQFFDMLKEKTIAWTQVEAYQEPEPKGSGLKRKPSLEGLASNRAKVRKSSGDIGPTRGKLKCFKCGKEGHPVFKCPLKPTKDEIQTLLNKRPKFSKDSGKSPLYLDVCRIGSDRNQIEVRISKSNLAFRGIMDSGSDYTLIPRSIALRVIEMDPSVRIERLSNPIMLRLGDRKTAMVADEKITVILTLRTKTGTLVTRQRECLI